MTSAYDFTATGIDGNPVDLSTFQGDPLLIVESMKMEIAVAAPMAGTVAEIRCAEGQAVTLGQTLAVLLPETA